MELAPVRSLAETFGYSEAAYSSSEGTVVFESNPHETENQAVVVVWIHQGTVGVILSHPRRERVQTFFFDVVLESLAAIFREPGKNDSSHYKQTSIVRYMSDDLLDEKSSIQRQLNTIDLEIADLVAERLMLNGRLQTSEIRTAVSSHNNSSSGGNTYNNTSISDLERKKRELADDIAKLQKQKTLTEEELKRGGNRNGLTLGNNDHLDLSSKHQAYEKRNNSQTSANNNNNNNNSSSQQQAFLAQKSMMLSRTFSSIERDSPSRSRGNRCVYSFANDEYQLEFGKAWSVKPVDLVSLGRGYVILYDDGGVAWWDIPQVLDTKLRDESESLPPVKYVALGPEGNYFIKFINGKMEWVAKDSFAAAVKEGVQERHLYVDKVALGQNGSWLVVWSDGSAEWENIPKDLATLLKTRDKKLPAIKDLSFGPNGEWFTIFKDHAVQANNLPDSLHRALADIKDQSGRVRQIVFGENGSWYIRYWDGS